MKDVPIFAYHNKDVLELTQMLADDHPDGVVGIINAANRSGIGNAWYKTHAQRAMDENLARRVLLMAIWSVVCNACINTQCDLTNCLEAGYKHWFRKCKFGVWIFAGVKANE